MAKEDYNSHFYKENPRAEVGNELRKIMKPSGNSKHSRMQLFQQSGIIDYDQWSNVMDGDTNKDSDTEA